MRTAVILVGAALALVWAAPASASVGLPRLAELRAGPHQVVLYNDSPTLVIGRNTLSLELPPGISVDAVRFALSHRADDTLLVPLRPVLVLAGAGGNGEAGGHGAAAAGPAPAGGHDAHVPAPPTGHGAHGVTAPAPPGGHDARAAAAATPAHDVPADSGAIVRGTVNIPSEGVWRAHVSVTDGDGTVHTDEITLDVTSGGPNELYLLATGSLMAGALLVGVAARHRIARRSLAGRTTSRQPER